MQARTRRAEATHAHTHTHTHAHPHSKQARAISKPFRSHLPTSWSTVHVRCAAATDAAATSVMRIAARGRSAIAEGEAKSGRRRRKKGKQGEAESVTSGRSGAAKCSSSQQTESSKCFLFSLCVCIHTVRFVYRGSEKRECVKERKRADFFPTIALSLALSAALLDATRRTPRSARALLSNQDGRRGRTTVELRRRRERAGRERKKKGTAGDQRRRARRSAPLLRPVLLLHHPTSLGPPPARSFFRSLRPSKSRGKKRGGAAGARASRLLCIPGCPPRLSLGLLPLPLLRAPLSPGPAKPACARRRLCRPSRALLSPRAPTAAMAER